MKKPWNTSDNCKNIRAYFDNYTVVEAALLWCGVPLEDFEEALRDARPLGESGILQVIYGSPFCPCLEGRCRLLANAIEDNELPVSRDGQTPRLLKEDQVARARWRIYVSDLKEWISKKFPNDKPATLFDEYERSTHTAITKEAYDSLKMERDNFKRRLDNAVVEYIKLRENRDSIQSENNSLKFLLNNATGQDKPLTESQRVVALKFVYALLCDHGITLNEKGELTNRKAIADLLVIAGASMDDKTITTWAKDAFALKEKNWDWRQK